jgi:hypothetical protein
MSCRRYTRCLVHDLSLARLQITGRLLELSDGTAEILLGTNEAIIIQRRAVTPSQEVQIRAHGWRGYWRLRHLSQGGFKGDENHRTRR